MWDSNEPSASVQRGGEGDGQCADQGRECSRGRPHRQRTTKTRRGGFTLVEMLIVVVMVSILATVSIGNFKANKGAAIEATIQADVRQLRAAEEAYFLRTGGYYYADNWTNGGAFPGASAIGFGGTGDNRLYARPASAGYGVYIQAGNPRAQRYCYISIPLAAGDYSYPMTCADGF